MGSIKAMQRAADKLNNSNIGYDKDTKQRWSFFQHGKIISGKEADCSSLCGAIIKLGGYQINLGLGINTNCFADRAMAAGFKKIKFSDLSQLKAGDFVVDPGKHVEFVYRPKGSLKSFFSAHENEHGNAYGGKAGNQNGKEVCFKPANTYHKWKYILRPPK